jgi:hypothetical protein
MEALILALIAVRNQYRQPVRSIPEPKEFPSFDLQALSHLPYTKDKSSSLLSERQASYVVQAVRR